MLQYSNVHRSHGSRHLGAPEQMHIRNTFLTFEHRLRNYIMCNSIVAGDGTAARDAICNLFIFRMPGNGWGRCVSAWHIAPPGIWQGVHCMGSRAFTANRRAEKRSSLFPHRPALVFRSESDYPRKASGSECSAHTKCRQFSNAKYALG